jgi:hypothetical protein
MCNRRLANTLLKLNPEFFPTTAHAQVAPLPEAIVRGILHQLLSGLAACHAEGAMMLPQTVSGCNRTRD